MANGFLPTNTGIGTIPPELFAQQQALNRQQQMANLLMQQGMNQPQGQMVSGQYVRPSIFQQLNPLAQLYVGQRISSKADKELEQQYKNIEAERKAESERLAKALRGQETVTEMAGPYGAGVGAGGANVPMPTATMQGQPDYRSAVEAIMQNRYGTGRELLPTLMNRAYPEPKKPVVVAPGGALVTESGQELYKAPFKPEAGEGVLGGGVNNNGVPVGRYDKMGRYISPEGRVFPAAAVTEAQKEHDVAMDLGYKLNNLTKSDIKNAYGSAFDYTASKVGQMVGNKKVVEAQNKINSIQIKNVLDNLSQLKGASSDKEMAQMIKDFPGYTSPPEVMEAWVERASKATNRFLKRSEKRFGFDTEYAKEGRFGNAEQKSKTSTAPQGIDQALWNAMTPDEQALWQK